MLVEGLENPESAIIGRDGKLYVTVIGKSDTNGDGTVVVVEDGKAKTFAKGLDDPKGLVAHGDNLYVADKTRASGRSTAPATRPFMPPPTRFPPSQNS